MPEYVDIKQRIAKRLFTIPESRLNFSPELLRIPSRDVLGESAVSLEALLSGVFPLIHGVGISMPTEGREELVFLTTMPAEAINVERLLIASDISPQETRYRVLRTGVISGCARPTKGGDSISLGSNFTGTLGAALVDQAGARFVLSCNHVLANLNSGKRGVDEVWQPGSNDGGKSANRLGVLHDYSTIALGTTVSNVIDAAIGKPDSSSDVTDGIRNIGSITGTNRKPRPNVGVRKNGWATGLTHGTLAMWNVSLINVFPNGATALFDQQYGILGVGKGFFAQRGDSGSIIVDDQDRAVGLLFAVAGGIDLAFANPIGDVLNYFSIDFL